MEPECDTRGKVIPSSAVYINFASPPLPKSLDDIVPSRPEYDNKLLEEIRLDRGLFEGNIVCVPQRIR